MKNLLVLIIIVFVFVPMRAQDCNNAKNNMVEALKVGNCKQVESFYNSIYLKEYNCPRDKKIELKIANCGKDNTPKPKPKPTTPTQPTGKDQTITVNGVSFKMVYVEGGTFTMGCTSEQEGDYDDDEKPAHKVTLSSYSIGETEVTQALWRAVMGSEPTYKDGWTKEYGRGKNYPAYKVSWDDVQRFIRELNRQTGLTFSQPTEAEWEYAARGGSKSQGYKYSGSNVIDEVAWYKENSEGKTHPVKTKKANELGLYDMSGNVWEWCYDMYEVYDNASQTNPQGPSYGSGRVRRGGSWNYKSRSCRVSNRDNFEQSFCYDGMGFRLVLEVGNEKNGKNSPVLSKIVSESKQGFDIIAGVFANKGNADQLCRELKASGCDSYIINRDGLYYVSMGSAASKTAAEALYKHIRSWYKEDINIKQW